MSADREEERRAVARSVADYEQLSGILWIILGVIQLCLIVTALAGVWNILAGISRLGMVKRIRAFDPTVPQAYEGMTQLILIGLVNLFVGGFFGLIFVGLDVFIRDRVLSNRWVFDGRPAEASAQRFGRIDLDALEQLGRLRTAGVLTDEEFDREKARLIGTT